jgi:hypothetical protein
MRYTHLSDLEIYNSCVHKLPKKEGLDGHPDPGLNLTAKYAQPKKEIDLYAMM